MGPTSVPPNWYSIPLMASIPAAIIYMFVRMIRSMRKRDEFAPPAEEPIAVIACPNCGYDLRATPHRCPECGTDVFKRREYLHSLTHDWPDNPLQVRTPQAHEAPIILLSTLDSWEAQTLVEQLNARGIFCRLGSSEPIGARTTVIFNRVMIYSGDLEFAKTYLRRAKGLPPQVDQELHSEVSL